ncbi:RNA methyltransferase [Mahella sp.]|uniref:TrmH family RNA methyltransferase n=1 Tax=Mahella sp. TaxID=2798721 RepID=UPI0025BB19AA|nr:RNA methyltransferase [Mahella sp.]MBZ4666194.1 tRNA/rRNA methyltransferase (SpoU) [Mahella sp.]
MIVSKDNPRIKLVRSLASSHGRKKSGLYFIEGARLVEEAIEANEDILFIVYSSDFSDNALMKLIIDNGIDNFSVLPDVFINISDTATPQGVLAVLKQQQRDWREITTLERCLLLILDAVQDPGNVGTMIRTADAMGFSAIVAGRGTADQYNPKVLRAAMGSSFHVPVYNDVPLSEALTELVERASVLAAVPRGGIAVNEAPLAERTAIVIGNEARGIDEEVMHKTTCAVSIDMPGRAESLNASIAAGIIMYEVSRRWYYTS